MSRLDARGRTSFLSTLVALFVVLLVPLGLIVLVGSPWLSSATTSALVTMVMVVGLYLFSGNSGVLAFGHVAFVAVGAYVCGILTIPAIAKPAILPNLPLVVSHLTVAPHLGVLAGGVASAALAAVVFFPLRRLNAQALSIVTLSLLLIANVFFTNVRLSSSGGAIFRVPIVASIWSVTPWLLAAIALALLFQHSRIGLRLRASREDEFAAASAGIDIGGTRLVAFVISAGAMGVGGGLYAVSIGSFSSADFFVEMTILLFAMMVVGGMRSLTGVLAGSALISTVNFLFSQLQNGVSLGSVSFNLPPGAANLSIALCMIIVLLIRREGLFGDWELGLPRFGARAKHAAQEGAIARH